MPHRHRRFRPRLRRATPPPGRSFANALLACGFNRDDLHLYTDRRGNTDVLIVTDDDRRRIGRIS